MEEKTNKEIKALRKEIQELRNSLTIIPKEEDDEINAIEVSMNGVAVRSNKPLNQISKVVSKLIKEHKDFVNDKRDITKFSWYNGIG